MSDPTEPSRESALDPSDPRWVEDILERARRRAEEVAHGTTTVVPPAAAEPVAAAPPVAPAPTPAPTPTPAPVVARTPAAEPPAPVADAPAPAPSRRVEVVPDALAPAAGTAPRSPRPTPDPTLAMGRPADATTTMVAERPVAPGADRGRDDAVDDEDADLDPPSRPMKSWIEWGAVILGALLVAFVIRAVLFQAFYIPSESMESTLEVKDRILVNKLSYKLHDVHRGDIVVFEKPPGETSKINDLIKRVIALPGETIEQQGNDIYIDRGQGPQKLTESYIKDRTDIGQPIAWVQGCANPSTEATKCTIPEGHVWVMGDNRGHSHDSRVFGPIDEDLIVGRAFVKVWPLNKIGFL